MSHDIKYPIALKRGTNELVNASDVENGFECGCYCFNCKEDLIAINKKNNKQRPHFRHYKECEINYETYIHWLSKETLLNINTINLPEIRFIDIKNSSEKLYKSFISSILKLYDSFNVPKKMRTYYSDNFTIQEKQILKISTAGEIEKIFNTKIGQIKVDYAYKVENNYFLIEPFYTNKIDDKKFKKISSIDYSTISINLNDFVKKNNHLFLKEDFITFLKQDIESKTWVYVRTKKIIKICDMFLSDLEEKLRTNIKYYNDYNKVESIASNLKNKEKEINNIIRKYRKELGSYISRIDDEEDKLKLILKGYNKNNKA